METDERKVYKLGMILDIHELSSWSEDKRLIGQICLFNNRDPGDLAPGGYCGADVYVYDHDTDKWEWHTIYPVKIKEIEDY